MPEDENDAQPAADETPAQEHAADATIMHVNGPEMGAGAHPNQELAIALENEDPNSPQAVERLSDLSKGPFLSEFGNNLPSLRRKLQELQTQEQQIEEQEKARMQTPLALTLQVVSCRWATEHFDENKTLPIINVQSSYCPKGLSTTNQDCRTCAYVKLIAYGTHEPTHQRRYHDHGMVIPIPNEAEAEKLASVLGAINMKPLRKISREIEAVQSAIERAEQIEQQVRIENLNLRRAQGAR